MVGWTRLWAQDMDMGSSQEVFLVLEVMLFITYNVSVAMISSITFTIV